MKYLLIITLLIFGILESISQNNKTLSNINETKIDINTDSLIIRTIGENNLPQPKIIKAKTPSTKRYLNSAIIVGKSNLHIKNKKAIKSEVPKNITLNNPETFKLTPSVKTINQKLIKRTKIKYPKPVNAQVPQYKDNANFDIQYLDVEQGMPSSYIQSIFIDTKDNIWIGTYGGGVSIYNGKTFVNFTEKEGLLNNGILCITEDSLGNIWLGTDGGGITKFNGNTFTHYTEKDGLLDNSILSIKIDSKGYIWCGTNGGGISCIKNNKFINYNINCGFPDNTINSITEDNNGNIWFATEESGIIIYNGKTFSHYTTKEGLPSNNIISIIEDNKKNIWFSTKNNGLCKLIKTNEGRLKIKHFTKKQGLSSNSLKWLKQDSKGDLWIGTNNSGLNKLTQKKINNKIEYIIYEFSDNNGLSGNDISSITEDNYNNIWIGTYGAGICRFNKNSFVQYTQKVGLTTNVIRSILEDSKNNLWFCSNGNGISIFDGENFNQLTKKEGLNSNYVNTILEDSKGNFWLGTKGGGICKYDGKYFTYFTKNDYLLDNTIWSSFEDSKGNLWFGSRHGGVCKFDGKSFTHFTTKSGLKDNTVWSILEDNNGDIWFGSYGDGLCKYDGKSFTYINDNNNFANTSGWCSFEDSQKKIWFGTKNHGVYIYDGKSILNYTKKQGLSNNTVWSIIEDDNNDIWIATENGLNLLKNAGKYKTNNILIKNINNQTFNKQDGLKALDFYAESVLIDSENNIWWGSGKSLTKLNLNNKTTDKKRPQIHLNNININQNFIDFRNLNDSLLNIKYDNIEAFYNYPTNLELSYNLNHITFNFTAIDWQAPHKIKYSYKLEGLDKTWSIANKENKAEYRNIPYGKYTFNVRAIGDSKIWGNTFKYSFIIKPPWWQTLFAKLIYIGLFILFIVLLIKWRTSKLKKEQKKLEDTVKERTLEISKINKELIDINNAKNRFFSIFSHDIKNPFGTLVSLTDYIDKSYFELDDNVRKEITETINKSAEQTYKLLENLLTWSQTQTKTTNYFPSKIDIEKIINESINLQEASLKTKNIKINFKNNSKLKAFADENLVKTIVRNLLNNAIKFSNNNSTITINIEEKNNMLNTYITDQGIGIKPDDVAKIFNIDTDTRKIGTSKEKGTGLGLMICKEFTQINKGKIWVNSILEKGSTFGFSLPITES